MLYSLHELVNRLVPACQDARRIHLHGDRPLQYTDLGVRVIQYGIIPPERGRFNRMRM